MLYLRADMRYQICDTGLITVDSVNGGAAFVNDDALRISQKIASYEVLLLFVKLKQNQTSDSSMSCEMFLLLVPLLLRVRRCTAT